MPRRSPAPSSSRPTTNSGDSRRAISPTSSPYPETRPRHRHHPRRAVRHEGWRDLQARTSARSARGTTENILWLLKQALYFSGTTVNEAISQHGVSTAQIGLLRQLADEPGLSGADLARRLLISPQGVQLALTALERRGLVQRKQDPQHGRILQAYLTDQGRKVAAAVVNDAMAAHDKVFGVLSRDEQETLRGLLGRVVEQGTGHKLFATISIPNERGRRSRCRHRTRPPSTTTTYRIGNTLLQTARSRACRRRRRAKPVPAEHVWHASSKAAPGCSTTTRSTTTKWPKAGC